MWIGFGIHPWFAHLYRDSLEQHLSSMRTYLEKNPAAFVGELGLDKSAKTKETGACEFEAQCEVFLQQMRIAGELKRPVSIHCVRA